MKDEDFVTKTINKGNVDIQKFPASKVWQLAKKMESSKATTKHIRQVTGDLLVAHIQLIWHQHAQLPARNYPRRKQTSTMRKKPQNHKSPEIPTPRKPSDLQKPDAHSDKCTRCGDTLHVKGFQCPARKFQCKICHKFGHFTTVHYQKSQQPSSSFKTKKTQGIATSSEGPYTPTMMLIEVDLTHQILKIPSVYRWRYTKTQISHPEVPKPVYLMANLSYHLQEHH